MAGLHFPITGDNTSFINSVREIKAEVEKTSKSIEKSGMSIEDVFDKGKRAIAAMGAAMSAQQFTQKVLEIRGQFQQLEVAFTTMLGSAEKANILMQQLTKTAVITPFGLQDVAGGAKQLLAYGIEAEKVNDTLIRLGDIAAGLSIPLNDLVYLYGTTMTQGRMFTMDLRQFMGRGIPIADELAKIFGVAKDEVAGLVTAGKVTSVEFTKAIENMTNSGSKFGGLMVEQSKTITGQISNIEDAIDVMFNEIGKSSEGVINSALSGISYLVGNYENVGEAITVAITAYGTYKAALMTSIALQKVHNALLGETALQKSLAAAQGIALSDAEAIATAKTILLTNAQRTLATTLKAVASSTILNPYVLLGATVATLGYGVYKLVTYETEAEKTQKRLNEITDAYIKNLTKERSEIDSLFRELRKADEGTKEYQESKDKIINNYGKYLEGLDSEVQSLNNVAAAYDAITLAAKNAAKQRALESATSKESDILIEKEAKANKSLQEALKKHFGDKRGDNGLLMSENYFDDIVGQFERTGKISEELTKKFDITRLVGVGGGTVSGGYESLVFNFVKDYQKQRENARKEYEAAIEEIETAYKVVTPAKDKGQEAPLTSSIKELRKQTIAEYKELLKAKEDFLNSDEKLTEQEQKKKLENLNEEIKLAKEKAELYGANFSQKDTKEQDKSAKELLDIQRKNQQDEIDLMKEGTEKKLAQIDLDYKQQIDAYNEAVKKYGMTGEVQAMKENADKEREQRTSEVYKERAKEMQDFLKEYGANQSDIIKQNIDWALVFGDLGMIVKSELQAQLASLKEYINSEEFKSLGVEDKETIIQSYNDLREQIGYTFDGMNFEKLGEAINNAEEKQKELNRAQEEYLKAIKDLEDSQKEYNEVVKTGTKEEIKKADNKVKDNETNVKSSKENLDNASQDFSNAGREVQEATDKIVGGFKQTEEILQNFTSNSLSGFYKGLNQLSDMTAKQEGAGFMDKAMQSIGNIMGGTLGSAIAGPVGSVIGEAIFGILDILKNGLENLIANLVDLVLGAINGLLNTLLSFDMAEAVGGAVINGTSNILNTVTFGGFNSAIDSLNGGNADEVNKAIERLTERNEILTDSIDRLSDIMDETKGGYKTIETGQRMIEQQEEKEQNLKEIVANEMKYSGNHHSWKHYFEPTEKMKQEYERITGETLKHSSDLLKLSADQTRDFLASPYVQEDIKDIGKSYYGSDVLKALQAYADEAGNMQEIIDQINESIVGISFDSFYDEFNDMLMDCEISADDFVENINKHFSRMFINNMVANKFAKELQVLYEGISGLGKEYASNSLSVEEYNAKMSVLREEYVQIMEDAKKEAEFIKEVTGYSDYTKQEASSKGFQSINQETGEELNGRFTALQIAGESIKAQMIAAVEGINRIGISSETESGMLSEMRNLAISSNGFLEDIAKYTKSILLQHGEKLDNIVTYTSRI